MKLDTINSQLASFIPSLQDLASAATMFKLGKPSVIYPGAGGNVIMYPIRGREPHLNAQKYSEIVRRTMESGNIDDLIAGLKEMGFEIFGEIDGSRVGRAVDPQLQTRAKQFGSQIPRSGTKEIGGESGMTSGGFPASKKASKRFTGTPEQVEIEVEVPQDAREGLLKNTDDFIFHTHPKITDNNYGPTNRNLR
jgi:hypothetical protein